MSADLLRLAASTVRVHLNELAPDARGDWDANCRDAWLGGPVGDFAALMSPPVALALADWLEATIENLEEFAQLAGGMRDGDLTSTDRAAIAVARAILREAVES